MKQIILLFLLYLVGCHQQLTIKQEQKEKMVTTNYPPPPKTDSMGMIIDSAYIAKLKKYRIRNDFFLNSIYSYIDKHKRYPQEAQEAGIEGHILIKFQVRPDSTIRFWHLDGIKGYGCDVEAERVIRAAVKANMDKVRPDMYSSQYAFSVFFEKD